jgi:hypothetical protein
MNSVRAGARQARWLIVVSLLGMIAVGLSGLREDQYLSHVRNVPDAQQAYPTGFIAAISAAMLFEAALIGSILYWRTSSSSWGRALIATHVALAIFAFVFASSMHMPPFWFAYVAWTLALFLLMLVLTVTRAVRARASEPG